MTSQHYSATALRSGLWHFVSGKALSAALSIVLLLWLVRLLPVSEYGAYATFIAGIEIGYAVAGLGLPWLAARYVPEFRLRAPVEALRTLAWKLLWWQLAALTAVALVAAVGVDAYLDWVGLSDYRLAAFAFLGCMIAEGVSRFIRDGLFGPLLLQREARRTLILKLGAMLCGVGWLATSGSADVHALALVELASSIVGCLASIALLRSRLLLMAAENADSGWRQPSWAKQYRVALSMYAAHLLTLLYSPQLFLSLLQRFAGAEAAAAFGFLRQLYELVARYLPAMLLFGLVRPKLIAAFVDGGMPAMQRNANLAGKLSLFALLPLLVIVAVVGDEGVLLLSGGKFGSYGLVLLCMLIALVPFSQRQLLESIAVASEQSGLCVVGAMAAALSAPVAAWLLSQGLGIWAIVIALLMGHSLFYAIVLVGLWRVAGYRPDVAGPWKMVCCAIVAWMFVEGVNLFEAGATWSTPVHVVVATVLVAGVYLGAGRIARPFNDDERQRINGLLRKRLFVW